MEQIEKDRIILDWIIKAKDFYIGENELNHGMCKAFRKVVYKNPDLEERLISLLRSMDYDLCKFEGRVMYKSEWLGDLIPEFNFNFLGGDTNTEAYKDVKDGKFSIWEIYWWNKLDNESRIEAFNKLIKVYEAKVYG